MFASNGLLVTLGVVGVYLLATTIFALVRGSRLRAETTLHIGNQHKFSASIEVQEAQAAARPGEPPLLEGDPNRNGTGKP